MQSDLADAVAAVAVQTRRPSRAQTLAMGVEKVILAVGALALQERSLCPSMESLNTKKNKERFSIDRLSV